MTYQLTKAEMENPDSFAADLEKLQTEAKRIVSETPKETKPILAKTEMDALSRTLGLPTDGSVSLSVAKDEMTCRATFLPPNLGGVPIDSSMVAVLLKKNGVTNGLDWDIIDDAIFACNSKQEQIADLVIARGLLPTSEIPSHFELVPESDEKENTDNNQSRNKSVDHRDRSTVRIVETGTVIARQVPKIIGTPGYTVKGREIPFKRTLIDEMRPGKNLTQIGDEIVSSCPGTLKTSSSSFWVEKILILESDIGYQTGHIRFPGDIIIKGEVKDGFNINGGGDIICEATLDASNIECKNDLIVRYGIIGKKDAIVHIGGKIQTRFIENCHLDAGGAIDFSVGIVNSVIKTQGHINGGKKSIIVGSEITAMNGLSVFQIGTRSGPVSEIMTGLDFRIKERIEWIRDKNIELAMKLTSVEQRLATSPSDKVAGEFREKIKTSIHELNDAAMHILPSLTNDNDVYVEVRGTVYPGTSIEIGHVPYVVTREMSGVRFLLDKKTGRIKVEKI